MNAPSSPVEVEQRLSRSLLWKLQRNYFHRAGIEAWRTSTVPHYVTNNPALAHAYAQVFLGFLRDCRSGTPDLDPAEPVTIVELGAGSGRFAYLFLKAFTEMHRRSAVADVRFRYVMTDFTETNLRFWREHASLRPFVEQGVLDFARFDAEVDGEIALVEAGVTLGAGALRGPLGVIANYVFDGITQDAFSFEGGALRECLVSLSASEPPTDLDDPALIGNLTASYTHRDAPMDYYGEGDLDAVLHGYARGLEGMTILFPCSAIRCIRRLADLAGGRLLLLSADYGDTGSAGERKDPGMAIHGSFSMSVNYHAIAEWVIARGGQVQKTAHRHAHLAVAAFTLGRHPRDYDEARLAYDLAVGRAGPDDFFSLRRGMHGGLSQIGLEAVLALLRMSYWDPQTLQECLTALWGYLESASEDMRADVTRAMVRAWENHYPLGEDLDLAFELGLLTHRYGAHAEALGLFRESIRLHGDDPRTRWNMGLCHWGMGETDEALRCFGEAARLNPGWKAVGALQIKEYPR